MQYSIDLLDLNSEIDDKGREFYTLNILHPTAYNDQTGKLERLCIQINETTQGTKEQTDNWRKKAKKVNDEYFKHEGKFIFAYTSVVYGFPNHVFLTHDLPDYIVMDTKIKLDEPELIKDTELKGSFLD